MEPPQSARSYRPIIESLKKGPLKVSVIGSGNWGSVISRVVASNVTSSYIFHDEVRIWVYEEIYEGKKLTEIINTTHQNPKYLPGIQLPVNITAIANIVEACVDADLLIFVLPHQFLSRVCYELHRSNVISKNAKAISLIKGLYIEDHRPMLFSSLISKTLGVDCCVLSGANVAKDVAREDFSETTIGYTDKEIAEIWQQLFDTPYFRVNGVPDVQGVEVCGAMKNVVALAAGFCDGLKLGTNTKAAIIRLGVEEMKGFANLFFSGIVEETFLDSAGYADVITTCFGGRNVRCAAEFVLCKGTKSWGDIEAEMLHGQKLQGNLTCREIEDVLEAHDLQNMFPLFHATYLVAFKQAPANTIIEVFMSSEPRRIKLQQECNSCIISKQVEHAKLRIDQEIVPASKRLANSQA